MKSEVRGLRVVITGSSSGIGLGMAKELNAQGCSVVINGRDAGKLKNAMNFLDGVTAIQADVSHPAGAEKLISEAVKHLGGLDAIICNVGGGVSVPAGHEDYDEWQRMFALNFWSATNIVEAGKEALIETAGTIVCVSSICGIDSIQGAPVTYSVAKAALNSYIRSISRPLAEKGVRINGVALGNIMFPGSVWQRKKSEDAESVKEMLNQNVPLKRFGTVDAVAEIILFILSSRASFISGAILVADGGQIRSY